MKTRTVECVVDAEGEPPEPEPELSTDFDLGDIADVISRSQ